MRGFIALVIGIVALVALVGFAAEKTFQTGDDVAALRERVSDLETIVDSLTTPPDARKWMNSAPVGRRLGR